MDRVLQLTPATASVIYYEDGVAVDPGAVTIQIDRADGTNLVVGGTATGGTGANARTYALTTTHTTTLDLLKLTWTSATKGVRITYIEVAGGYLFSLSDLDGLLQTPSDHTAAQKNTVRLWAEQRIEQCIGRSFVPRYAYEVLDGRRVLVRTTHRPVRSIRSVDTRVRTVWTAQTVANYDIAYAGIAGYYWPAGYRNVRVGYEYGEDSPSEDVSQAAALWAKVRLVQGPVDDRELQRFISDTGAVVNLSTPGRNSWSGIPDVDAVIAAERIPVVA